MQLYSHPSGSVFIYLTCLSLLVKRFMKQEKHSNGTSYQIQEPLHMKKKIKKKKIALRISFSNLESFETNL